MRCGFNFDQPRWRRRSYLFSRLRGTSRRVLRYAGTRRADRSGSRSRCSLYSAPQASCFLLKKKARKHAACFASVECGRLRRPHLDGRVAPSMTRRAAACMLFPPPWFSPLDPLFRGAPFQKGIPPGGKTHPRCGAFSAFTGGNSTAFFALKSAALRVPAATPPLNPLCAFRPQGRGALVRPPPAQPVQGFDTVSAFQGTAAGL